MSDAYRIRIGSPIPVITTLSPGTAFPLDDNTDLIEGIIQAPAAATITRLAYFQSTVDGTSPTYRISLQGVDSSGLPDGTIKASTNAFGTFQPTSGNNNSMQWVNLGSSYTCTRGEMLAVVIDYSSGTINASNRTNFRTNYANAGFRGFPYIIQNAAGSRSRQGGFPLIAYGSSSRAYGYPLNPSQTSSIDPTSATNPNEYAMKFSLPSSWGSSYKVVGMRIITSITAGGTFTMNLYQGGGASDTTAAQSVQFDTDLVGVTTHGVFDLYFDETTLTTLNFGSTNRVSLQADSASTIRMGYIGTMDAADWDAWPGGQYFARSTRNGGNWTDSAVHRMYWDLILDDWTATPGGRRPRARTIGA